MEQLCIVDQTIAELAAIVEKHEGCFPRIIASTLKDNGVDLQAYFSENILGNHCYKFGENGEAIIDTIKSKFLLYLRPEVQIVVEEFLDRMKKYWESGTE